MPESSVKCCRASEAVFQVFKQWVRQQSKLLILSRLRSFVLNNVLLINVSQRTKGNQTDCEDLVTRIVQLLDPIGKTLRNENATDIDLRLTEDLKRFTEYVS